MKTIRLFAAALSLALVLTACAAPEPTPQARVLPGGIPLTIVVATDLHFLDPAIVREGEAFTAAYAYGDGKQLNYGSQLVDVFVAEMLEQRPAAVLLTGDLTLNGERVSHLELARRLAALPQAGIPVLVIPGNHDIQNAFSSGYNRDKLYDVRSVTAGEFAEIYRDCGYGQAASRDAASLSYTWPLSDDLWLVMLDTNLYDREGSRSIPQNAGALPEETLVWLEDQLREAQKKGAEVITATHHNLLNHTSRQMEGYTLDNAEAMLSILERYGTRLNLSGHVHIQDIARERLGAKDFYDIATSSFVVYTNQYGVLEYQPGVELRYHTREANVERWARETGSQDPDLLAFEDYSYRFFYETSKERSYASLVMAQLNQDADLELMSETMALLNPAYFSGYAGDLREEIIQSDHYAMWRKHSGFAPIGYINSMLAERELDPRQVVIPLGD